MPSKRDDDIKWESFTRRLATLQVVGGIPAIRLELDKYEDQLLSKLSDLALEASVITDLDEDARKAAIEIAALVLDLIQSRKKETDDG